MARDGSVAHYYYTVTTAFGLAVDSLRAHKLRSFLTLLGVIIGVSSVVLVGAAIEGMGNYAETSTQKLFGSETYLIDNLASVGRLSKRELAEKLRRNKRLKQDDLQYLRLATGDKIQYSPYQQRSEDVKREEATFESAAIIGVSASLPEIREIVVVEGRFFTDQEEQNRQPVVVIGEDVRTALFPNGSPLGKKMKIHGVEFTVVGLLEKIGSTFGRGSQDNPCYIPATVFAKLYSNRTGFAVFGRPRPGTRLTLDDGLDLTRVALRARWHARPGQPDPFDVLTPDSIRAFVDNILRLVSAVVVPVTAISLVVGGIVIMNIMLVSVTERTREIGIRKAIGARRSDILLQFLIEAAMLAAVGGVMGLALGALAAAGISALIGVNLQVTPTYVILALFVSSATGIISGWYPASRASKMDPVVALRAE